MTARGSLAANDTAGGGVRPNSASCAATRRPMNFGAGLEIGACQHVVRCFPTRLPSEDRSERDAPVGVLVVWNEGPWKKLPATGCFDVAMASVKLRDDCNVTEV